MISECIAVALYRSVLVSKARCLAVARRNDSSRADALGLGSGAGDCGDTDQHGRSNKWMHG